LEQPLWIASSHKIWITGAGTTEAIRYRIASIPITDAVIDKT